MNRPKLDWLLIIPSLLLLILSVSILSSVAPDLAKTQLFFAIGVAAIFLVTTAIDLEIIFSLHWLSYGFFMLLSILTMVFGFVSRGSQRWIDLGFTNIQPSELMKPFLLISFAAVAASALKNKNILLLIMGLVPVSIVFLQPDLGTTLVIAVGWGSIIMSRFPLKILFAFLVIGGLLAVPVYQFALHEYQRERLITFINPNHDPLGKGYHVIQSTIAVGSGQIVGRGLGRGTQTQLKFLPEHHTDFIFASISEELGFVGAITCIILYGLIFWRIYVISQSTSDMRFALYCLSTLAMLGFQTFVNIGMNIGIAPITGITLPLLSYGGSSLLSAAISLATVNAVSAQMRRDSVLVIQ